MTYKNYEQKSIGCSDIAALTLTGMRPADEPGDGTGLKTCALHFGGDGSYDAYVVDDDAEIGAHYALEATFAHWLKIYDDDELVREFDADIIKVYRAGDFGCIVQLCKAEKPKAYKYVDDYLCGTHRGYICVKDRNIESPIEPIPAPETLGRQINARRAARYLLSKGCTHWAKSATQVDYRCGDRTLYNTQYCYDYYNGYVVA